MKVIRLHAPGDVRIHEETLPHSGLDETVHTRSAATAKVAGE